MKMSSIEKLFVNSPRHSQRVSDHAQTLLNRIAVTPGQKYLDLGCGNGAAPIRIARHYPLDVTGVDVDPAQIRMAQEASAGMNNVHFQTLDGAELPFADAEFDIVATNKVMHHIPQWELAFGEMVRVLKRDGCLIFSDLIYVRWLATLGNALAKKYAGFPTRRGIDKVAARHKLRPLYGAASPAHYEAIWQKKTTE
ncbi:MAG: class I SAM-dependent methyltransferase [Caldilineaceae bacterium]